MKIFFDYLPLIIFFAVYKIAGMYPDASHALAAEYLGALVAGGVLLPDQGPIMLATAAVVVATTAQILYVKASGRKVDGMLWISFAVITVMGAATLYFHNENFIKWKPTILYWALAVMLGAAQLVFKKNLMRKAMEKTISLPDAVWSRVGLAWAGFFAVLGALNLVAAYVVFNGDTDAWVNFKVFGITALFLVFIVGQTLMLSKYIQEEKA